MKILFPENLFIFAPVRKFRGDGSPLFHLKMNSLDNIKKLVEQWMAGNDIFLVDIKLSPGKLVIYVDKPSGILLDECAALNRFLFENLDASGFNEQHAIEVSSPGIDYPFRVRQQYQKNIGRQVKVVTFEGEQFQGKLESINQNGIVLAVKKNKSSPVQQKELLFDTIKEARAVISFNHENISLS